MRPTREQIELAAYHRWQRRGSAHGADRDDWVAAEKDLVFALNYRYVARYKLTGPPVRLGQAEASRGRRCRFCERSEPSATFSEPPLALPAPFGNTSLTAWDECDDCRDQYEASLAEPFEAFAGPLLADPPELPRGGVPVSALKGLVRAALSALPASELHHFGDTAEWVANPDHARDASLVHELGLGCRVYQTPEPVPAPSFALARRADDDAPWPYMVAFLAASRVVLQTHLPFCPRDEDLEGAGSCGPELSMSLGTGPGHRASRCVFVPAEPPARVPQPSGSGRDGFAARSQKG